MRKVVFAWAILALYIGFSTPTHAQNLVLNPSFEEMDTCPNSISQFARAIGWTVPNNNFSTPDLFASCGHGVPKHVLGYHFPKTGCAYAGMCLFHLGICYVENIQGTLLSPLLAGQKYKISMYIGLGDSCVYAVPKISVYFYTPPIQFWPYDDCYTFLNPQVNINIPYSHINNRTEWTYIESEYIATGGEKYFILGNFQGFGARDSIHTGLHTTDHFGNLSGYYIIDDISIESDNSNYIQTISNQKEVFAYPSPSHDGVFTIENTEKINHIIIYDIQGKVVKQLNPSMQDKYTIDISELPAGLYSAVLNYTHHTPQHVLLYYAP